MGRVRTYRRPPSSGAVIFYGRSGRSQPNEPLVPKSKKNGSEETLATSRASTSSEETDLSRLSLADSSYRSSFSSGSQSSSVPGQVVHDFGAIISVSKDIISLFSNAPYIQFIANTLLQIIKITEEVHANKERTDELIQKIVLYAGVVFDALKSPHVRTSTGLDDLKGDLVQLGKVLDSSLSTLQALFDKKQTSRFAQILRREDHSGKIQELDRKLDAVITSFQVKSAIVLRSSQYTSPTSYKTEPSTTQIARSPPLTRIRSKPRIMLGRNIDISSRVDIILNQSPARLAILGPGGIGKTSVALAVLHDEKVTARFGQNRLFISCEAATSGSHILLDLAWALRLPIEGIQDRLLEAICDQLRSSAYLIVLDNFETPWEASDARSEIEFLLQELDSIETVTLLFTMRGSQHPINVTWSKLSPPLQPVDIESARQIFKTICKQDDEYTLKLVTAVDCVPLAVTLLANLAAVDGETTEVLWKRWSKENISMVESGNDRLYSIEASIKLSLTSPRMQQNPEALKLLSTIALLPQGITPELMTCLERGIPGISNTMKAMATLRQNSLVSSDSSGFFWLLSPIRLHVVSHHPPPHEARRTLQEYFIDLAFRASTSEAHSLNDHLFREAGNMDPILMDCLDREVSSRRLDDVAQAILSYCHYTYLFGSASTSALLTAIKALENNPPPSPRPEFQNKTGDSSTPHKVHHLWRHRLGGLRFWKEKTKPDQLPQEVTASATISYLKLRADCMGCLGQLYTRESDFDAAEEALGEAKELHLQAGDVAGQAYDIHNLACLLSRRWLDDTSDPDDTTGSDDCIEMFEEASRLHEQAGDTAGMAYDLLGLGNHLLQTPDYSRAEDFILEALSLFRELGNTAGEASCLTGLGQTNLSSSSFAKSKDYFEQALAKESDDIVGKAENLAGLASTYLLRSYFGEALRYIEEAIAIRSPIENPDHLHILGRVFVAQYRFDDAEKTLRRSLALHTQLQDSVGIADDQLYLTNVRFYRGHLRVGESEYTQRDNEVEDQDNEDASWVHPFDKMADGYKSNTIGYANASAIKGAIRLVWQGSNPKDIKADTSFEDDNAIDNAFNDLEEGFRAFKLLGCRLGQAFSLYHWACAEIRCGQLASAQEKLQEAFQLHQEVGNVQGEADDHNKLAEIDMRQNLLQDAMNRVTGSALKLHTQIGDIGGQGNDIYLQACIYLKQGRLEEAEEAIRQALDLHTRAELAYQKGLTLATLSSIVWQKFLALAGETNDASLSEAHGHLEEAIRIFRRCHSRLEYRQCSLQLLEMKAAAISSS